MSTGSETIARWVCTLRYEDLPDDVVGATRLRVLDTMGLMLAGLGTAFGQAVLATGRALGAHGAGRAVGNRETFGVPLAAFVNGALSQALEFDDTHNESIVHMSGPSTAAALALAEHVRIDGRALLLAVAIGNEIACRVGSVAPGQFHRRGFHPTGLFTPFGTTCLAGRLLGVAPAQLQHALGITGSFAAGILECWVDGTQSKFLHSGHAAQNGIIAAHLGAAGVTGPGAVFEGRFGLFASHLQDAAAPSDFARISAGLGEHWESRRASFKPFPAAHVLHPYIDALLRLKRDYAIDPRDVDEIVCPVPAYIVPIVCEPVAEKQRPQSDSHGRVSLQYTLAEALSLGRLDKDAYAATSLANPEILRLARCVRCEVDPTFPGPERFKGAVTVVLRDGRRLSAVEEHNRGSAENPLSEADLRAKFERNAATMLEPAAVARLADAISALDALPDASELVTLTIPG